MIKKEFQENIYKVLAVSNNQPDRFNCKLGLQLIDCSAGNEDSVAGAAPGESSAPGATPGPAPGAIPWAEFRYEGKEEHKNPYGGIHGGVICGLADTCSGMGAVALTGRYVTTTDLQVSFIRAMAGSRFRIRVEYTQVGRTLIRCMGKIYDEDTGKLMAASMATFMAFEDLPPGLRD